jgi:hypothetical protein
VQTDCDLAGRAHLVSADNACRFAIDSDAKPSRGRRVTGCIENCRRIGLRFLVGNGLAAVHVDVVDGDNIDAFGSHVHA